MTDSQTDSHTSTPSGTKASTSRKLLTGIAELFTPFEQLPDAALAIEDGRVAWVGRQRDLPATFQRWPRDDLGGRGVLPGLVDCHTHLLWAGSRLEEYRLRARGADYAAILEAGGGIHQTVRATAAASDDELLELARARAAKLLRGGVTSLEVKSGYGLEPAQELRLLELIARLDELVPQRLTATLLAHVVPPGWAREAYLQTFTEELIPEVARRRLATAVDVFCDRGAFTLDESRRILEAALAHGLAVKAHAEQLEHTGATRLVCELRGLSADHLERTTRDDWAALAASGVVGTVLPGAAVILRAPLPPARAMADAGVKLAVATDHNPGSSPLTSLLLALQLTVALGGLSVEEALVAGTAHAADALAEPHWGRLEPDAAADLLVVDGPEALRPLYEWGPAPLAAVMIGGEPVWVASDT